MAVEETIVAQQEGIRPLPENLLPLPSNRMLNDEELVAQANLLRPHLDGLSLTGKIAVIHDWYRPQVTASGIEQYTNPESVFYRNDEILAPQVTEVVTTLTQGEEDLRNKVAVSREKGHFTALEKRMHNADALFEERGEEIALLLEAQYGIAVDRNKLKAAFRFRGGPVVMSSDFDGSLTDDQQVMRTMGGLVDPTLLGSELADPLHGPGRIHFKQVFGAIWRPLLLAFPEVFEEGGKNVPFRNGAAELLAFAIAHGMSPTIDTTNFTPFPDAAIAQLSDQTGLFDPSELGMVTVNTDPITGINAALKGDVILTLADMLNALAVHNADSSSDEPALSAKDVVIFYTALRGGKFVPRLQAEQAQDPSLLFFEYDDAQEVLELYQTIFWLRDQIDAFFATETAIKTTYSPRRFRQNA